MNPKNSAIIEITKLDPSFERRMVVISGMLKKQITNLNMLSGWLELVAKTMEDFEEHIEQMTPYVEKVFEEISLMREDLEKN
jgi:hypothetical protein